MAINPIKLGTYEETKVAGPIYEFEYTNYKDEFSRRRVVVLGFQFGSNEYHQERGLLMLCWDLDKSSYRSFSTKDIDWNSMELVDV